MLERETRRPHEVLAQAKAQRTGSTRPRVATCAGWRAQCDRSHTHLVNRLFERLVECRGGRHGTLEVLDVGQYNGDLHLFVPRVKDSTRMARCGVASNLSLQGLPDKAARLSPILAWWKHPVLANP